MVRTLEHLKSKLTSEIEELESNDCRSVYGDDILCKKLMLDLVDEKLNNRFCGEEAF